MDIIIIDFDFQLKIIVKVSFICNNILHEYHNLFTIQYMAKSMWATT